MGRRFLPYSTSTQYTCLIQSASDPQNLYPTPCTLGIKVDKDPSLFNVSSPLSFPGVLTVSPTLINFILLSFCLISGNSFPTHTRTRTELSWHGISRVGLGHHSTSQQGVSVQGAGGPLSPEAVRGALLSGWWSGDRSAAERGRGSPPCMWSHASQLELHSQDFPWC